MNSVFQDNTPSPQRVVVADVPYSRQERRHGVFVVISKGEFVVLKTQKPPTFSGSEKLESCSQFTYQNALRVCGKLIHTNPKIKLVYRDFKTKTLKLK